MYSTLSLFRLDQVDFACQVGGSSRSSTPAKAKRCGDGELEHGVGMSRCRLDLRPPNKQVLCQLCSGGVVPRMRGWWASSRQPSLLLGSTRADSLGLLPLPTANDHSRLDEVPGTALIELIRSVLPRLRWRSAPRWMLGLQQGQCALEPKRVSQKTKNTEHIVA